VELATELHLVQKLAPQYRYGVMRTQNTDLNIIIFLSISGSKYSSNINEIDKSEQKSSPDATGKGIPYEWPQNDSGCKYHIFIYPTSHQMFIKCILE
jgi:hypothetical protein